MKIIEKIKLKVDETHTLNILECGNKNGVPVIFLHGGPGGSVGEKSLEFFNENHHVILFDQRGTGKSTPFLETKNVTPFHTIEDMEKIREHFGIEKWTVFGGSYGSTLALLYAILHPERVENLVLRGIFLGREEDVHWLYEEGASYYFPELFDEYKNFLPENKRNKIVASYYEIFMSDDEIIEQYKGLEREEASRLAVEITSDFMRQIEDYVDGYYIITPFSRVDIVGKLIQLFKSV